MEKLTHSSLSQYKLSPEENQRLLKLCSEGDPDARERIILAYLPYVSSLCRKYEGKGVPYDDLFQEGSYGLMLALEKYDYSRNTSFASHATHYIEKHLRKAQISQSSFQPIVYKEDFFYEIQGYLRVLDEQTEMLNRSPSNHELAKALKTTEKKIRKLSQSLYTFFPIQDLVADMNCDNTDHLPTSPTEDAALNNVLDLSCLNIGLSSREREILRRRFGFTDTGIPEDIASISAAMGLSYETIRITYERCINRIREAVAEQGYTVSTIQI